MKSRTSSLAYVSLLSLSILGSCGGGAASTSAAIGGSQSMFIVSCSLGCGSGKSGAQVHCGPNSIFVNEELLIEFSLPVDLATVNKSTFRVVNLATGKVPIGSYSLVPSEPRKLIYRPQVTFDSSGSPIFGLDAGASYQIDIPGSAQDPGLTYIKSSDGIANSSRMFCTVVAGKGVHDPIPGKPSVTVTVDKVTSYDAHGDPAGFELGVAADGAVDVYRDSSITLSFDDVMNPATLVNPATGTSPSIRVFVDLDGDVTDSSDQSELAGAFQIDLDPGALHTIVSFTPTGGFPSAGTGALPRRIVVQIPPTILDLGGNALDNFGSVAFVPELVVFDSTWLPDGTGEAFQSTKNQDTRRSGAAWGQGGLLPGVGGGSGRLGDCVVAGGKALDVSTAQHELDGSDGLGGASQVVAQGSIDPAPGAPTSDVIGDGVFEFARVLVDTGSVLRFSGPRPARLLARGELQIRGLIDVAGSAPADNTSALTGHQSWAPNGDSAGQAASLKGGAAGVAGPGGGDGGRGADRPDDSTHPSLLALIGDAKGVSNPGAVVDGFSGVGVGGGVATLGAGGGGAHWPPTLPSSSAPPPLAPPFAGAYFLDSTCQSDLVGGVGAGGAFATDGDAGVNLAPQLLLNGALVPFLAPPPAAIGSAASLDPALRTLDPELGLLRGGAGGGGGGSGIAYTKTVPFSGNCYAFAMTEYYSHSAAGGGGGGGALQLQAGRRVQIDGFVDATGGRGGDAAPFGFGDPRGGARPGGGGSGGGVLVQSNEISIADTPAHIDVSGGSGGIGQDSSSGGSGGAGFVRIESTLSADPLVLAPKIAPYEPSSDTYGGADSDRVLSTAPWIAQTSGASSRSGAQSCWLRASGNYFQLEFAADSPAQPGEPDSGLGWDVDVATNISGFATLSWREPLAALGGLSLEQWLGSDLGGATPSPIAIRFQGARALDADADLCSIDALDPAGPIVPGSVTAWVRHPAELNDYFSYLPAGAAAKLRSNMIRFQVIFDRSAGYLPNPLLGVTNLRIRAKPQ